MIISHILKQINDINAVNISIIQTSMHIFCFAKTAILVVPKVFGMFVTLCRKLSQMNGNFAFEQPRTFRLTERSSGNGNCSRSIPVAVASECCVKRVICKTWTRVRAGVLTNSADPDQTPQNAASDQGLYCLLKLQE